MPRLTRKLPSYRLHKPSGQAVVTLGGRDHYLGPHGSPDSRDKYDRLLAEWLASHRQAPPAPTGNPHPPVAELTVGELLLAYTAFAESYYVKDGQPTREAENLKAAMRPLAELYHSTRACDFGPLALKAVRQAMIERDWCRRTAHLPAQDHRPIGE